MSGTRKRISVKRKLRKNPIDLSWFTNRRTVIEPVSKSHWVNTFKIECAHFRVCIIGELVVKIPWTNNIASRFQSRLKMINELAGKVKGVEPCWAFRSVYFERYAGETFNKEKHADVVDYIVSEQKRIMNDINHAGFRVDDARKDQNWCYQPSTGNVTLVDRYQIRRIRRRPK